MEQRTPNKSYTDYTQLMHTIQLRASGKVHTDIAYQNHDIKHLTYHKLHQKAKAIAAHIQEVVACQASAFVLYDNNIDLLYAFLGCLYAGVTPIALPLKKIKQQPLLLITYYKKYQPSLYICNQATQVHLAKALKNRKSFYEMWPLITDLLRIQQAPKWVQPAIDRAQAVLCHHAQFMERINALCEKICLFAPALIGKENFTGAIAQTIHRHPLTGSTQQWAIVS